MGLTGGSFSSGIVLEVTIAVTPRTATVVNKTISDADRVIDFNYQIIISYYVIYR